MTAKCFETTTRRFLRVFGGRRQGERDGTFAIAVVILKRNASRSYLYLSFQCEMVDRISNLTVGTEE